MRRVGAAIAIAVTLASLTACGGGSNESTSDPVVQSTTTAAPTTTVDALTADTATIKATIRSINSAYKTSFLAGQTANAAAAWPEGEWSSETILGCQATQGQTYEEFMAAAEDLGVTVETFVDAVEPDPGWSVPPGSTPGSGQTPPGRIYIVRTTVSVLGEDSTEEAHWAVTDDGRAWWFPVGCPA